MGLIIAANVLAVFEVAVSRGVLALAVCEVKYR
jgi:hypothetical protein